MPFTKEEEDFVKRQETELNALKSNKNFVQSQIAQQATAIQEEEKNIVREQLDLSEEINVIEHLLRGHVLKDDGKTGTRQWVVVDDPDMVILSEHGVHLIMNTILFYMNKNTLLSNYDEETINKKMEDFACDLADTIFMEYEKVFKYPTFKQCKEVLLERINKKTELRKFALELAGIKTDDEKIKQGFIEEIEGQVDREITKIKEQIIKNKLKRFLIIIREVQDAIHSTYLRAYAGQERKTLRQHIHVSETLGAPVIQKKPTKINPLNWRQ